MVEHLTDNIVTMNPEDFKKLVKDYTTEDVSSDEPHVTMRCQENSITLDKVKHIILDQDTNLVRIIRDRPDVYKLYYRLNMRRELKIVIDLLTHKKINIRTVKILDGLYHIGSVRRQRF